MCRLGDHAAAKGATVFLQFALPPQGEGETRILVGADAALRTMPETAYHTLVAQIIHCLYQLRTKPLDDITFAWGEDHDA